jgi:hypothetical protein
MTGPYMRLPILNETDDATTMAIYLLRQYVTGRVENLTDIMTILAKLEDLRPSLETACDEMRCALAVPPWDNEQKKWLSHKAFNMIVNEINKPSIEETCYQAKPPEYDLATEAA